LFHFVHFYRPGDGGSGAGGAVAAVLVVLIVIIAVVLVVLYIRNQWGFKDKVTSRIYFLYLTRKSNVQYMHIFT
jgi:heme/copper-type cytochrome/quinol oxidase subunit 4